MGSKSKVYKYFRAISHNDEDFERELYYREPYSEVKNFEDFTGRCIMLQLRGEPPPRGWMGNSREFSTAYWNLDRRITAFHRSRLVSPPPFDGPRGNVPRHNYAEAPPPYTSTATLNRTYGCPPSYHQAQRYSRRGSGF